MLDSVTKSKLFTNIVFVSLVTVTWLQILENKFSDFSNRQFWLWNKVYWFTVIIRTSNNNLNSSYQHLQICFNSSFNLLLIRLQNIRFEDLLNADYNQTYITIKLKVMSFVIIYFSKRFTTLKIPSVDWCSYF